jgi:predicted ATPase
LRAGEIEAGLAVVAEALRRADETGDRGGEPVLWRLRGELLLARGLADETEAEACLQKALAVARRQSARLPELAAATTLARLWRQRDKRAAARDLLGPIYGWFTEGFDYPELQAARALLDELSAP